MINDNDTDNFLSDDDTMTLYTALLDAFALTLDDATITAITTDAPRARDFIASLAHDPDAHDLAYAMICD